MRKYPRNAQWNAETAIRKMSEKAQLTSDSIDPLTVWEYSDGEENFYDARGGLGDYTGLTFDELEELLESDWYGMQEYFRCEYEKMKQRASAEGATQEDIDAFEEWLEDNREDMKTYEVEEA